MDVAARHLFAPARRDARRNDLTVAHYWTGTNWLLLICGLIAELSLLLISIKRGLLRSFVMLPIFAGVGFAADVAALVIGLTVRADAAKGALYTSHFYFTFYWYQQCAIAALLLLLALQTTTLIVPPWARVITLLGILVFSVMAAAYLRILPSWEPSRIVRAVTVASAVTIAALAINWVIKSDEWPAGMRWIMAGLILSAILQGICTGLAEYFKTMRGFAVYGIPAAGLLGMILYSLGAGRYEQKENPRSH